MSPITFACTGLIPKTALEICADMTNLSLWPAFTGYGPMPGIKSAEFEKPPEDMNHLVGTRILVQNTDGSRHVEDILVWQPGQHVVMKLHEFTAPLSNIATHFVEDWTFAPSAGGTQVTRRFEMHPKRAGGGASFEVSQPCLAL
jgi:hypothetical protein